MTRLFQNLKAWISRQPIRRKLQFKSRLVAFSAASMVALVFAGYRLIALRTDHLANALAITRMVAENSTGAVAFQDSAAASAVLASLRANDIVIGAAIDLPNQKDFATFGSPPPLEDRLNELESYRFDRWILHTSATIGDEGKTSAQLEVISDLRPELWATFRAVLVAFAAALALALTLSQAISRYLLRFILRPIEALQVAAQQVTHNVANTDRAPVLSADELGELTIAFNHMLDRLQSSATELRTSNESLTTEIAERRRLEKALVDTSRQAGMAEVATGILHNVGNVLNSVNISAQVMRDNLDRSQLFNLVRAADLIQAQGERFPQFVGTDPKGRLLPAFIVNLAGALTKERDTASLELGQLAKNIEHIKEIVSAQQGFAKMVGVTEKLMPRELFDEAERIAQASVLRHGIAIEHVYADTPALLVDRHRALQILVNFITNAIHAVKANAAGERRIILRITPTSSSGVAFSVVDNGVGIAAENLSRIFTLGFTTRREGHGFGLHSGAISARLMQGEVRVKSDGVGTGATFTLDLPIEPQGKTGGTRAPYSVAATPAVSPSR